VFLPNGNLFIETAKIWFGDLDLTLDEDAVVEIARRAGTTVYVLHEHDGRVAGRERNPTCTPPSSSPEATERSSWAAVSEETRTDSSAWLRARRVSETA
jgi:hypothetical protein